ncbi:hypothetical protein BDV30DRAFT_217192 [Aspergillus minisclerotigenes]|uniref:Uncharacterized protein n=1 Tax=Aspergillus minisclerotigenes TaxID=656917 RepID=A0A5N6IR40_9EURO|nr:hypothetical protein BDV30DRAFT_217192 [Aspergillus minisclerotigenes]
MRSPPALSPLTPSLSQPMRSPPALSPLTPSLSLRRRSPPALSPLTPSLPIRRSLLTTPSPSRRSPRQPPSLLLSALSRLLLSPLAPRLSPFPSLRLTSLRSPPHSVSRQPCRL